MADVEPTGDPVAVEGGGTAETLATSESDESASYVGYDYTGFIIFIKCLGLCSMAASSFLLRDVYLRLRRVTASTAGTTSWRQKVSLTQSVLFCLSLGDFFSAFFVQFLSTWMVPSHVAVAMSSGTVTSCTVQGCLGYLFYGLSAFSNASLAVAYSLIVKWGWKDDDKDRYRLPFALTPIACSIVLCIIPLFGENYNYSGSFFCDIAAAPLGCDYPDSTTQCKRGAEARNMLLYVGVIPFMIAFVIIIYAVVLLVCSVLGQERRMDRYLREGMSANRTMTRQTARQGIYYILAFGVAWIPWYIYAILEFSQGDITEALGVVHYTTMPLQGVFNSLVYFRPKYKSQRAHGLSRIDALQRVLNISLPALNCRCYKSRPEPKPDEAKTAKITHTGLEGQKGNGQRENGEREKEMDEDQENTRNNNTAGGVVAVAKGKTEASSVRFPDAV